MISVDDSVRALAILAWAVVIWRGVRARSLDETWWSCVLLAFAATVTITSNAQLLADVTGVSALATLLANVSAVLAAALLVRWQALASIRADHGPFPIPALVGCAGVAVAGLVVTWLSAPHSPDTAATHPAIALHWLTVHAALLAASSVVGLAKLREVRALPPSGIRAATTFLLAAAACLSLASALGVVMAVAALAGTPPSGPLPHLVAQLRGACVLLFLAGISAPLIRPAATAGIADEVGALASRLGCPEVELAPDVSGTAPGLRLFPLVVEIRDRMWELQQRVDRRDVAAATAHARRLRLTGTSARAFTTAACLEVGLAAEAEDPDGRSADPADLSRLGGGRTPAEEARWLATITRVRRTQDVAGAARRIRGHVVSVRGTRAEGGG